MVDYAQITDIEAVMSEEESNIPEPAFIDRQPGAIETSPYTAHQIKVAGSMASLETLGKLIQNSKELEDLMRGTKNLAGQMAEDHENSPPCAALTPGFDNIKKAKSRDWVKTRPHE
jgi:hypothetical protein